MVDRFLNISGLARSVAVTLVAAVVLTVVAYFAVLSPVHASWDEQTQLSAQADQRDNDVRAIRDELEQARAHLESIRDELAHEQIDLGDASQINRRIAALIALAQGNGLEVAQLQPGGKETAEHYQMLALQLEAVATPDAHAQFLAKLYERFPDMSVLAMDLTVTRGQRPARPRGVYRMIWFTQRAAPAATPAEPAQPADAAS